MESGKEVHKLEGHSNWVTSVSFSSDGRHISSGSADETVRVWDVESGKEVHKLHASGNEDLTTTKNWSYLDGKIMRLCSAGIPQAGNKTCVYFDIGIYYVLSCRGNARVMGDRSGQVHILQLQRIEDESVRR